MVNQIDEPTDLLGAVDYQPGTVVSRVVFRSASGTMSVFAFAEGEGLSEHSNPSDAIVFMLEGSVGITIGARELALREGEIVHLPANAPHALHGGSPFKMLLTILKNAPAT